MRTDKYGTRLIEIQKDVEGETHGRLPDGRTWHKLLPYIEKLPPYKKGDILYVREAYCPDYFDGGIAGYRDGGMRGNRNAYKADYHKETVGDYVPEPKWTPSIHMPKSAARIWLKVTDVRAERIQDIDGQEVLKEGVNSQVHPDADYFDGNQREMYAELWDSTISKKEIVLYGWDANPWVWVIGFERCKKPEGA